MSVIETLYEACRLGNIDYIKRTLLSMSDSNIHISINTRDNKGYTLIEYAAYYDHLDIVTLLLQYGANISDLHRLVLRSLTSSLIDACNSYRIDMPIHPIEDNMSISDTIIDYMIDRYQPYYASRTGIINILSTLIRQHIDTLI